MRGPIESFACDMPTIRPCLRASPPYNASVLRAADPEHPAARHADAAGTKVFVEWGARAADEGEDVAGPCTLVARAHPPGAVDEDVVAKAAWGAPLEIQLPHATGAGVFRCELRDAKDRRITAMHAHIPPRTRLATDIALTALVPPPLSDASAVLAPHATAHAAECADAKLAARGFGIELELICLPPEWSGFATKKEEIAAVLAAAADDHNAPLCARLAMWENTVDAAVAPFEPAGAAAACAAAQPGTAAHTNPVEAAAFMSRTKGVASIEFKSPRPPNELRFSRGAAAEIRAAVALLAWRGAAAPDVCERGCAAALHVHVDVMHGAAPLSVRQLMCVFMTWVEMEFTVSSMTRSWVRRDKWAAPLYATGPEFAFTDKPWEQGLRPLTRGAAALDVPGFLRRAHAAWHAGDRDVASIFRETPGRLASLNVEAILKTGTVEFRCHHATLDPADVARWARFCVAFVDAASRDDAWASLLFDADSAESCLRLLAEAQLRSTRSRLRGLVGAHGVSDADLALLFQQGCVA